MSSLTLSRPTATTTTSTATSFRQVRTSPVVVGSYADAGGVRRAPRTAGSYTSTAAAAGAYAGRSTVVGSYVRTGR